MSLSSSATPLLETEPSLQMGLQSVLRSLDVGLEDELARYRRKKRLQQPLPSRGARAAEKQSARSVSPAVEEARAALGQLTQRPGLGDKLFPTSSTPLSAMPTAAMPIAATSAVAPTAATAAVDPASVVATAMDSASEEEVEAAGAVPLESSLVPQEESDSSSETAAAEVTAGLAQTSSPDDNSPDNYFASSAALLESLTQEEEEPIASSKGRSAMVEKLLSPAGVGTSMLLLLGSATAGYLLLHPESLSHLQASNLLAKSTSQAVDPSSASSVDPELPPGAPDLSQKEFVDLTLSNLGRLDLREGSPSNASTVLPTVPSTILPGNSLANSVSPSANQTAASQEPGVTTGPQVNPPTQRTGLLSNLANAVAGPSPNPPAAVQAPASPATLQMAPETPLPSVLPSPVVLPAAPVAPSAPVSAPVGPAPAAEAWAPEADVSDAEIFSEEIAPEPPTTDSFFEEVPFTEPLPSEGEFSDPVELTAPEVDYSSDSSAEVGTFVVVTPYKSDLALSQAQQFAPDAYVRNTDAGALIQIGIHDSAETANSVVEQLQREGLDAYVE